ncbi:MAG: ABC transporter permease [Firmicutes bacterium]|nr:ABC transporter permease [Bacillota bacterium]
MSMQKNNNMEYEHIPQEQFAFAQLDATLHDKKLETKNRSFFADAMIRFKKNKSSVIAAYILLFLLIFTFAAPIISPYTMDNKDKFYVNTPPYIESIAQKGWGIFDGAVVRESQNEASMNYWKGIAEETGMNPVIKVLGQTGTTSIFRGKEKITYTYTIETNKYYETGMIYRTFSYEEFDAIQEWQNETGIQVIYPYVETKDIQGITDNPNLWYEVDAKGAAKLDKDGNFVPVYSTNKEVEGRPYNSIRIEGDDGSYIYSARKSGAVHCRVLYYNYYQFMNGTEPFYIFGTNSMGQDLFAGIGVGARFSLVFAIVVSAINLSIGAIYGAIQGYYGGKVDLIMDRIADILSGVPFTVVTVLFQLHLAQKVGVVPSFLFAFVMTGWIGMAALTRKQFYRFKSQEFVFAARTLGASDKRLMFKHVFPNAMGTIITSCALVIPGVIRSETSMTYLGIVNLQDLAGTSIGTLMSQGQTAMTTSPHSMLYPALYFALLLISFNLFGNGLRDAFNPSTRGVED